MLLKDISYLGSGGRFCSVERNHLCNFGKGHYEEQISVIILNFDRSLGRKCH